MSGIQQNDLDGRIIRQSMANSNEGTNDNPGKMYFIGKKIETKNHYLNLFPKRFTLILSVIQCVVALIGILSQVIIQTSDDEKPKYRYLRGVGHFGTGIWCGLVFGFSGSLGIIASLKQNKSCITASMISSIIAAVFGVPFFIISSIGTGHTAYVEDNTGGTKHAMFAIQMAISITQIFASASSSAISCQAVCNCCKDSNGNEGQDQSSNIPKLPMRILSLVQLLIVILIIIMEISRMTIERSTMPLAGGIWSGIIIGISGIMGLITSFNSSNLKIILLIVFDVIGATFCFPLIAFSSIGVAYPRRTVGPEFPLCATILALSILEVIVTTCSLILACMSVCNCCGQNKESGTIYYAPAYHDNVGSERFIAANTQSVIFKATQGYNNVPTPEMDLTGSIVSSDSLSNENHASSTQNLFSESNSNGFTNKSSKWQRFE